MHNSPHPPAEGKFLCPMCNSFTSSYNSLSPEGDVGVPRLVVVSLMIGWVLLPVWLKLREGRDEQ